MAACLLVVLGAALIAAASGLSMALGAFIAGLLLAETEYRREIEVTIEPFKGLLLGLFFVSVGAGLDLSLAASRPGLEFGISPLSWSSKAAALYPLARAFGASRGDGAQRRADAGARRRIRLRADRRCASRAASSTPTSGRIALVAAALSMLMLPLLGRAWPRLASRRARADPAGRSAGDAARGRRPSRHSRRLRPGRRADRRNAGRPQDPVHRGRFRRQSGRARAPRRPPRLFRRRLAAGIPAPLRHRNRARAGRHDGRAARQRDVVEIARKLRPDITLVARARDAEHASMLYQLGVTDAVPETVEASLQLSEAVLVDLGVPMGYVIASIHEKRDEYRSCWWPRRARPLAAPPPRSPAAVEFGPAPRPNSCSRRPRPLRRDRMAARPDQLSATPRRPRRARESPAADR